MDDYDVNMLREAKSQYMARLENKIFRPLYVGLVSIYEQSKEAAAAQGHTDHTFAIFQDKLAEVKVWNQDRINDEYATVVELSKCDWLEDLVTAVFISQCKVYTSIRITKNAKHFQLMLPKTEHFIHQVYVECARRLWPYVYLFDDSQPYVKRQMNLRNIEGYIREAIDETVGSLLPIKEITAAYAKLDDEVVAPAASAPTVETQTSTAVDVSGSTVVAPIVQENTPDAQDIPLGVAEVAMLVGDASGTSVDVSGTIEPVIVDPDVKAVTITEDALTGGNSGAVSSEPAPAIPDDIPVLNIDEPDVVVPVVAPEPVAVPVPVAAPAAALETPKFVEYDQVFGGKTATAIDDEEVESEPLAASDFVDLEPPTIPASQALSELDFQTLE